MNRDIFHAAVACLLLAISSCAYSSDLSAFADLLIWKARPGGAENWAQTMTPAGTSQSDDLYGVPFTWSPGIRLGLSDPSFHLDWTHYQTKATTSASNRVFSAFLGNFFANNTNGDNFGPFYNSADLQWKFFYDTLDLQWGRTLKSDAVLALYPFIGIKAAFIRQTINSAWQGPNTTVSGVTVPITTFNRATEIIENNFWGIGPSLGLNTTWPLYKKDDSTLNLLGNFSGALLSGHWRFRDDYQNDTPVAITVKFADLHSAAPMAAALLGLEWVNNQKHLKVRLAYEAQVWFSQMQCYTLNMGRLNNPLTLHGGVLGVSYQF